MEGKTNLFCLELLVQSGAKVEAQLKIFVHPFSLSVDLKVNLLDIQERTPLHYAALHDRASAGRLLMNRGAHPKLKDSVRSPSLSLYRGTRLQYIKFRRERRPRIWPTRIIATTTSRFSPMMNWRDASAVLEQQEPAKVCPSQSLSLILRSQPFFSPRTRCWVSKRSNASRVERWCLCSWRTSAS